MKQLILLLLLVVGTTLQGQSFDFTCEEPDIPTTLTVDTDMWLEGDLGYHSEVITLSPNILKYSYELDIPYGYQASGALPFGYNGISISGVASASILTVNIVLDADYDFSVSKVVPAIGIAKHITAGPVDEVRITADIEIDGIDNPGSSFLLREYHAESGVITIELPVSVGIVQSQGSISSNQNGYSYTLNSFEPGDRTITIDIEAHENFNYTQEDIHMVFNTLNSKFSLNYGEVEITVFIKDGISQDVLFASGKGNTADVTITLPGGKRVVKDIPAAGWLYAIGNNKLQYYISPRFVGDNTVGVRLRILDGFNYAGSDIFLDLEDDFFGGHIGIPEVDPGDLGNWFFHDVNGTPQSVPDTVLGTVSTKWKVSDDANGQNETYVLSEDNLMHTFYDSNLHVIEGVFDIAAETSSTDIAFPGIEGGDYDSYALIHNGEDADFFAKWKEGSKSYKVLVIIHDTGDYASNYKIGGEFIDIR